MTKNFSIYLDLLRFTAAFLVFLDHLVSYGFFTTEQAYFIPQLGREAVIIFFVLSGYVIAYTTDTRNPNVTDYFIARAARIYSVALPILLLAFIAFAINFFLFNDSTPNYQINSFYIYIPFHLLFVGELWNLSEVPPWLGTYWSLNYEIWYYTLFGVFFYSPKSLKWPLCFVVASIMGHKLLLLLPIWLSGVWLYYFIQKNAANESNNTPVLLGLFASFIMILVYKFFDFDESTRTIGQAFWPFTELSLGSADRYIGDYIVTIFILLNFYFAYRCNLKLKFSSIIQKVASYTFTLYLLHTITLAIWQSVIGIDNVSFINTLGVLLFTLIAVYIVGNFTEHKKHVYSKLFRSLLNIKK